MTKTTSKTNAIAVTPYDPQTYSPLPPIAKNSDTLPQFIIAPAQLFV